MLEIKHLTVKIEYLTWLSGSGTIRHILSTSVQTEMAKEGNGRSIKMAKATMKSLHASSRL